MLSKYQDVRDYLITHITTSYPTITVSVGVPQELNTIPSVRFSLARPIETIERRGVKSYQHEMAIKMGIEFAYAEEDAWIDSIQTFINTIMQDGHGDSCVESLWIESVEWTNNAERTQCTIVATSRYWANYA